MSYAENHRRQMADEVKEDWQPLNRKKTDRRKQIVKNYALKIGMLLVLLLACYEMFK